MSMPWVSMMRRQCKCLSVLRTLVLQYGHVFFEAKHFFAHLRQKMWLQAVLIGTTAICKTLGQVMTRPISCRDYIPRSR